MVFLVHPPELTGQPSFHAIDSSWVHRLLRRTKACMDINQTMARLMPPDISRRRQCRRTKIYEHNSLSEINSISRASLYGDLIRCAIADYSSTASDSEPVPSSHVPRLHSAQGCLFFFSSSPNFHFHFLIFFQRIISHLPFSEFQIS